MTKEEFAAGLGLVKSERGKLFDSVPRTKVGEFVLAIYLGKKDCIHKELKYLYGRIQLSEPAFTADKDWKAVLKLEYTTMIDKMYESAQKEFGETLIEIVTQVEFEDKAELSTMTQAVEDWLKEESDGS